MIEIAHALIAHARSHISHTCVRQCCFRELLFLLSSWRQLPVTHPILICRSAIRGAGCPEKGVRPGPGHTTNGLFYRRSGVRVVASRQIKRMPPGAAWRVYELGRKIMSHLGLTPYFMVITHLGGNAIVSVSVASVVVSGYRSCAARHAGTVAGSFRTVLVSS